MAGAPFAQRPASPLVSHGGSTACYELQDQHDHSGNEQNPHKGADRVDMDQTQNPGDQQNYENCPKQVAPPQ